MNSSCFDIIAFCLKKIQLENDWRPFDDLVLNHQSHPAQYEWLGKSLARENVLHPGNGWGKTDVIAKKHLRFLLQHFLDGGKYKTLNVAITSEQSELVQDRIVDFINGSSLLNEIHFLDKSKIVKFPYPRLTYCNQSSTEFKTTKRKGESIEGKEYGYISADEIALEMHLEFIRDKILLPRIRKWRDSQLDFSATPKGLNAFYRIRQDVARKGGYVQGGSSYDNPYVDHTLFDYQRSSWSQAKVDQIILGLFIDTAEMMFASRIEKLFDNELILSDGVDEGALYVEGWDLARGRKGSISDQTVGYRIRTNSNPHVICKRWGFQLPWTEKGRENINAANKFKIENSSIEREIRTAHYESQAKVFLDSTGVGDTLWEMLMDIARPVNFCGGNKDVILDHLQAVIDAGILKSPFIPKLADQMTTYQRNDSNLETDDIMALAIACSNIPVMRKNFGTVAG
jgi:hypothetical protein